MSKIASRNPERESKFLKKLGIECAVLGIVSVVVCGYGYAASNTDLQISGEAKVDATLAFGTNYMQELTPALCKKAAVGTTAQLIDKRDGKKYWVTKFKDNNCWMTQNLAFDLTNGITVQSSDTAITQNWKATVTTLTEVTSTNVSTDVTGTKTWGFNNYLLINPNDSGCGSKKNGPQACPSVFLQVGSRKPSSDPDFYKNNGNKTYTATEYDAHYLVGNFYQFNAITAGKGAALTTGTTSWSLCPKNWVLPGSQDADTYSYANLRKKEGVTSNYGPMALPPYYVGRVGYINPSASVLYTEGGSRIYTWEDRVNSATMAYSFFMAGMGSDASSTQKYWALPARCLVKGT